MLKYFLGILLSFVVSSSFAQIQGPQPLPMDQAFVFTTYVDEKDNLTFQWNVAPGYFLYQNKFNFSLSPSKLNIGKIAWPKGIIKKDFAGKTYPIYSGLIKLKVPLLGSFRGPIVMTINYQGCSLSGFCYAPVVRYLHVDISNIKPLQDLTKHVSAKLSSNQTFLSDQNRAETIFAGHGIVFILFSFLGLGLLLAFTPCVLPMIPILSGIIVGHQKKISTLHAFSLSFAYVLGMAMTYAVVGIVVASLGSSIQPLFQKPWIIILFSIMFVLLAISLFGFYELQLPARWQKHTTTLSNRLESGTYIGVFLMGCLSTLIVSPCVTAPLVGVLAYIAQTGDKLLGGSALLMLGLGMGIPLLLIGTSAGKWLPKAGQWMDLVKKLFGVLMLGVAIWMLSRVVSGPISLIMWSILLVGTGLYLGLFNNIIKRGKLIFRMTGSLLIVYGVILIVGAALGNSDPFNPWAGWNKTIDNTSLFKVVKNNKDLLVKLNEAKKNKKPVILDFYAKWCTSCVVMDNTVFERESVREALNDFVLLRIDITENDVFDQTIMKKYHVIAPPEMVFLNVDGEVVTSKEIVGEINETELLKRIDEIKSLVK